MARASYKIDYLQMLTDKVSFSRLDLFESMRKSGIEIGEAVFKSTLQKLLNSGKIIRVGRNAYCVAGEEVKQYDYDYSDYATEIAECVIETYPYLNFTVSELIQFNEFVNHQISHNVVFISIEEDIGDFVFDTLKEKYPGKVFIYPTLEMYHRYRCDDMIVIEKLISEAPMGHQEKWYTRIEKLLVDLLADRLLGASISEGEYATILEDSFRKYAVDESCMFRYARRRGAEKKIKELKIYIYLVISLLMNIHGYLDIVIKIILKKLMHLKKNIEMWMY